MKTKTQPFAPMFKKVLATPNNMHEKLYDRVKNGSDYCNSHQYQHIFAVRETRRTLSLWSELRTFFHTNPVQKIPLQNYNRIHVDNLMQFFNKF